MAYLAPWRFDSPFSTPYCATAALAAVFMVGCAQAREQPAPGGAHPAGWATVDADGQVDTSNPNFHGTWLRANAFPLSQCAECHGQDYAGGSVAVSCTQSGCHTSPGGPLDCTTCHGSQGVPRPASGAHWAHAKFCDTCHEIPAQTTAGVESHASAGASAVVHLGNLAVQGDAGVVPAWDEAAQTCSDTYCHGAVSPPWRSTSQIACDACHGAPPSGHAPWSRVANGLSSCATCHPTPTVASLPASPTHVDGQVEFMASCTTCHGSDGHAYPPLSLDGSTDPTNPGVGAHQRHLDGDLPDRSTNPLPCDDCHVVPSAVVQPGHLVSAQARVVFAWGPQFGARDSFDPSSVSCNVWCHFNRTPDVDAGPGRDPVWTDDTGDARQCNSCHDYPPVLCRDGNLHPSLPPNPDVAVCQLCHVFSNATHVNGVVDFRP